MGGIKPSRRAWTVQHGKRTDPHCHPNRCLIGAKFSKARWYCYPSTVSFLAGPQGWQTCFLITPSGPEPRQVSRMSTRETISNYTDRMTQLLPGEFVAVYLSATQLVRTELSLRQPILLCLIAVFLVLIPLFLFRLKGVRDRTRIIMVTASFLVWAYALGDAFQPGLWLQANLHNATVGAVLLLVWSLVLPLVSGVAGDRSV